MQARRGGRGQTAGAQISIHFEVCVMEARRNRTEEAGCKACATPGSQRRRLVRCSLPCPVLWCLHASWGSQTALATRTMMTVCWATMLGGPDEAWVDSTWGRTKASLPVLICVTRRMGIDGPAAIG